VGVAGADTGAEIAAEVSARRQEKGANVGGLTFAQVPKEIRGKRGISVPRETKRNIDCYRTFHVEHHLNRCWQESRFLLHLFQVEQMVVSRADSGGPVRKSLPYLFCDQKFIVLSIR